MPLLMTRTLRAVKFGFEKISTWATSKPQFFRSSFDRPSKYSVSVCPLPTRDIPLRGASQETVFVLAKNEFTSMIKDCLGPQAMRVRGQIRRACNMQDLWHLRACIFKLLSLQTSQWHAQQQLERLNRFFPIKPSVGFVRSIAGIA
jgi:hypothetical protein